MGRQYLINWEILDLLLKHNSSQLLFFFITMYILLMYFSFLKTFTITPCLQNWQLTNPTPGIILDYKQHVNRRIQCIHLISLNSSKTQCKDEFRNLSGCFPEILTASRIDIIFFLNTIRKLLSIAFQPCISLGGVHMVEMGQKNDFVQILGLKTPI